ncbi:MAG TPA: D-glycero-beta-D-manno-heptose 1-phosphate adenylyltransferase [Euzebyales bacterium]
MRPLVIVGDVLLDRDLDGDARRLAPDAPVPVVDRPAERARPGGAGLAALLAAADGRDVVLVSALGADEAGRRVEARLTDARVRVVDLGLAGETPQKIRVRADGHPLVRIDLGAPSSVRAPADDALDVLDGAPTVLVSDYGRGVAADAVVRNALAGVIERGGHVVWDPHPRGARPVPGTRLATPNLAEARRIVDLPGDPPTPQAVTVAADALRDRWSTVGMVVTLGARGALFVGPDGTPLMVPAPSLDGPVDPCGAGDRFAVAIASALADGAVLSEAVVGAVDAASAFVARGGATAVDDEASGASDAGIRSPGTHDATGRVAAVRASGGTVVATGGCFDLLHAGHVRLLADARRLGDCLVVCMNSDASVRRLKGRGRPVVAEHDRRAVLLALAAVDAVVIFDEDTPERVLDELRPDVWVKGADYAVTDMPEADLLATWGGQAVVLPYLAGRSTSSIIEEAVSHAIH